MARQGQSGAIYPSTDSFLKLPSPDNSPLCKCKSILTLACLLHKKKSSGYSPYDGRCIIHNVMPTFLKACHDNLNDCAETAPAALARRSAAAASKASIHAVLSFSALPFLISFLIVALVAWQKLYPLVSGQHSGGTSRATKSPRAGPVPILSTAGKHWIRMSDVRDAAAALAFSTTIALSAVLAELIFCEIASAGDAAVRRAAQETTIRALLVSLVLVTPMLEIHAAVASVVGLMGVGRAWVLVGILCDAIGLSAWLAAFWWIGEAVLGDAKIDGGMGRSSLSSGALERIGIIGISLMAALAGFAAVSSIWQTFGVKHSRVRETDITRKKTGLDNTTELLEVKQSRLRALERKLADAPPGTFFTRVVGTLRGNADTHELSALQMEVAGLETMQSTLSNSVSLLRSRYSAQRRETTAYGRLCLTTSYLFTIYCVYRIGAAAWSIARRSLLRSPATSGSDPINNVLALIATHWDPSLDRAAWSDNLSFLLSGGMLLASFNAVLQTVLLFSRFTPTRLLQSAQRNLALLVSQISGTYVVSSALLLRSNLPQKMGSSIEGALGGAPLDTTFVEQWFEGWFLGACVATAMGIWAIKSIAGADELDDGFMDEVDLEQGKRNR